MSSSRTIFLVAGEASADLHASALLRELRESGCEFTAFGMGGKKLAAEGMDIVVDASELSIVGLTGWIDKLGGALAAFKKLKELARKEKPDIAVLLDLPDFNLRLVPHLKKMGIPIVYYISPQVWAWRRYRVKKIKRSVDRMLVVFPFEKEFYEQYGVDVTFVGHPLIDHLSHRDHYREQSEIEESPRFAFLPGSRRSEIEFHAPILNSVASALQITYPTAKFRVPLASTLEPELLREHFDANIEISQEGSYEVLKWADAAVVASGTATLETALIGTPFCLLYRLSPFNSFLFGKVLRYKNFLGMPNLLAKREVAKEFVNHNADPKAIYEECIRLVEDPAYRQAVVSGLRESRTVLGQPGASRRAAKEIADVLNRGISREGMAGAAVPSFT
jgi:lipid-A-disaccharide synthase